MFNLKHGYLNKKGFTLLELILGIGIMSLLVITFYTILTFNLKVNEKALLEDEILLNGRYILEYIKGEINSADKIIVSDKFEGLDGKFPNNIGFVIVKVTRYEKTNPKFKDNIYRESESSYTTYYFKDNNLIRINGKYPSNEFPYVSIFGGYNKLGERLLESSNIRLEEDNLIHIDLSMGKDGKEIAKFKSTIAPRCPLVR